VAVISVVVPAHNEASVIGRLLGRLMPTDGRADLDIVVVANGCSDDTAAVAASFGPAVRVVELPVASKRAALDAGDELAKGYPRIYVDADVELTADDVAALAAALRCPGILACAPERAVNLAGRSLPVRWYYETWTRLPQVREGLFGRGAIAVSAAGHERLASLPPLLADDLACSLAFAPGERTIVAQATAVVHAPRTLPDLVRRRVRATLTVTQLERTAGAPTSTARTRPGELAAIARNEPRLAPSVAFFLLLALGARFGAWRSRRRADYSNWLRDESSRSLVPAESLRSLIGCLSRKQATEKTATMVSVRRAPRTRLAEPFWDSGPVAPTRWADI
jgi:Glycosyl transferase family 2